MMPPHFMLYGDVQMTLLGPQRAAMEAPLASAFALGLNVTLHCDCPSASPNVMEAIGTAVTRATLSGQILGAGQRVSPYTALLGMTRNAAYFYREEAIKGTITAGKIADPGDPGWQSAHRRSRHDQGHRCSRDDQTGRSRSSPQLSPRV